MVRAPKEAKFLGTTTRPSFCCKIDKGVLDKLKVRICILGNHLSEDCFNPS